MSELAVKMGQTRVAVFADSLTDRQLDLAAKREPGYRALGVMDEQLAETDFLAGDDCTIADIALYAYTHRAGEGGFSLEDFANVQRWLETVRKQPGHVSMDNALN